MIKKLVVTLSLVCGLGLSTLSQAVTWTISDPNTSPGLNFHALAGEGPLSYFIEYQEESPTLSLMDDPQFFELRDESDNPVDADIFVGLFGAQGREILIQNIEGEGNFHLHVFAGAASDGNGFAIAGDGNPFVADKTRPVGVVTGPFESDLLTPMSLIEMGGDAYYVVDFSVDHLAEPERSLTEVDTFFMSPTEGVWNDPGGYIALMLDGASVDDEDVLSADISVMRTGGVYAVRLENILGDEGDIGIQVDGGAVRDNALWTALNIVGPAVELRDFSGPDIQIGSPQPAFSNGETVIFEVSYNNADTVTLEAEDVIVRTDSIISLNLTVVMVSSSLYQVEISDIDGEGELWIEIVSGTAADADGDLASAAGPSDRAGVDTIGPKVEFGDPVPFYTLTGPADIPVEFVDAVSVSLLPSQVVVNTTGTVAYGSISLVESSTTERLVRFEDITGEGEISIEIPPNVAVDQYLQGSISSTQSPVINISEPPPLSATITGPDTSYTVSGPVRYEVRYEGVDTIFLNTSQISLELLGTASVATVELSGVGLSRTITLNDIAGEGAVRVNVDAGSANDSFGGLAPALSSELVAVGVDDIDGDLVPNSVEIYIDLTDETNPSSYLDTDHDLVPDYVELVLEHTNPNDFYDRLDDDKGLTPNYAELLRTIPIADPNDESDDQVDRDGDGLPDYLEWVLDSNGSIPGVFDPNNADAPIANGALDDDLDGVSNALEYYLNHLLERADTSPLDDFDGDIFPDYLEVLRGLDPELAFNRLDIDSDGISDRVEAAAGGALDISADADIDGIPDFIEYVIDPSRVNTADSPETFISERIPGSPIVDASTDTDSDGVNDLDELSLGLNPFVRDEPVVTFVLKQSLAGKFVPVCRIDKNLGPAELSLRVSNMQTGISVIDWSATDTELFNNSATGFDTLTIDPENLEGSYFARASVTRQSSSALVSSFEFSVKVVDGVADLDADHNGLCANEVADHLKVVERRTGSYTMGDIEVPYGLFVRTGVLRSFDSQPASMTLSNESLASNGALVAPAAASLVDDGFTALTLRAHFEVLNLAQVGESAQIIIPFDTGGFSSIPENSRYRVLTSSGWADFDESGDALESSLQACGSSPVFESGLITDALCIRLTIVDGGLNDLDGNLNGVISHLGVPSLEGDVVIPGTDIEDDSEDGVDERFADFEPGSTKVKVGSAGSFSTVLHLLLLTVLVLSHVSVRASVFGGEFWQRFSPSNVLALEKLYVGAALGQSGVDPDFSNVYSSVDESDVGFKLWLSYELRDRWFVEGEYANLGSGSLEGSEGAIATNVFPEQFTEELNYQHSGVTGLYRHPLPVSKFMPVNDLYAFAKAGLAYADIQSDLDIEVEDRISPNLGLGLQYNIQQKYWARFEYETFSEDSRLLSLGLAMRIGEPKEEPEPVVEEIIPPVAIIEHKPEPVEEMLVEDSPEEIVDETGDIDKFIEKLDPVESTVNMEQLYADLKNSLEPSLLFDKGQATLSDRVMGNLDELVYFMDAYPDVTVILTGHASDEGHEYLNENLARLRAHGSKTYLQANGIESKRVIVRSRGEHFPKYSPDDEDYRIRNRRLELDFYIPKNR